MSTPRPNILWIMTDEQRTDSLGCYGSAWAKTPNLDALAANGVRFDHGYCQSPVCLPSRASQLSCRYPHECGVFGNDTSVTYPQGTVTFPEFFAAAGYTTTNIGKAHAPRHPIWQRDEHCRHFRQYAAPRKLGEGYDPRDYRVVFDQTSGLILGGTYPGGMDNPSRHVTDQGIEFLRQHRGDSPFLLRVSHLWPHTPVLPPAPFDTTYQPGEIPVRYFDHEAVGNRSLRDRRWGDQFGLRHMERETFEQIWIDYMGLCAYVDHETGRLLDALYSSEWAENTIVLFSSDHGRALGEYGAAEKHTFDDAVWRVPFILSWPGHLDEGSVRQDLCELVDTGRTLAGLAGLQDNVPQPWRGRDLFQDPIPPTDTQAAFGTIGYPDNQTAEAIAYAGKRKNIDAHKAQGAAMRVAIRTRQYRMDINWMYQGRRIADEDPDGQLFDVNNDPMERHNRFNDPEYQSVVAKLKSRLDEWMSRPLNGTSLSR